jgi:hypothetical protein
VQTASYDFYIPTLYLPIVIKLLYFLQGQYNLLYIKKAFPLRKALPIISFFGTRELNLSLYYFFLNSHCVSTVSIQSAKTLFQNP